jgi:hypothetical protein
MFEQMGSTITNNISLFGLPETWIWHYVPFASAAYIRAAASRAGVPVRQACHDPTGRPGHPAP